MGVYDYYSYMPCIEFFHCHCQGKIIVLIIYVDIYIGRYIWHKYTHIYIHIKETNHIKVRQAQSRILQTHKTSSLSLMDISFHHSRTYIRPTEKYITTIHPYHMHMLSLSLSHCFTWLPSCTSLNTVLCAVFIDICIN